MARSYPLETFDLDFFDEAPVRHVIDVRLPVTPQRAWAEFTRQHTLDWCRAIKTIEFTSPAPYGPGTTRKAVLGPGYVTLEEHFFDWTENADEGHYRNGFRVERANVPGIRRFGEATEISPTDAGCRLRWTFALELPTTSRAVTAFSGPASSTVYKTIEADTLKYFAHLDPAQ
ncbi:SRPBCC family protein [Gordonia sp. zg691]|uniref:SRPBCC family protein n=1 Tax=Gordonia jinghuaiqii TaxID=2758710 RepID=A0A7D7LTG3_9ACTN|nr:SRPBCC family protein [Gordonia jinghuaiqii]MBD0862064.1 SRPBCC family protein [Gordonia jinghuaiqii]MCR5978710.1 SRPBCC family protein [Gordonia jinghuaiqii]QMT03023.1 SRPBCC family protein [Gordonia jinghuaiqii]